MEKTHAPARGASLVAERQDRSASERVARGLKRVLGVTAHLADGVGRFELRPLDHERDRFVEAHRTGGKADVDDHARGAPQKILEA